jgi:hypothetical protein
VRIFGQLLTPPPVTPAVGRLEFANWSNDRQEAFSMYTRFSSKIVRFPTECSNCNSREGTAKYKVSSFDVLGGITREVSVPICDPCLAEVKRKLRRNTILIVAQFLLVLFTGGLLIGNNPALQQSDFVTLLFFTIALVLPALEYKFLVTKQRPARFDFVGRLHFRNITYHSKFNKLNDSGITS